MKKLALSLDELRVETFTTQQVAPERGTVQAHLEGPTFNATCKYTDAHFGTCCGIGC